MLAHRAAALAGRRATALAAAAPRAVGRRPLLLAGAGAALLGGGAARAAAASDLPDLLAGARFAEEWPFSAEDLSRYDESSDALFYEAPRFVTHIDDAAIAALTDYYSSVFPPRGAAKPAILDLCSSWVSHYPWGLLDSYSDARVAGLGMNGEELARNEQLTEFAVRDLNVDPTLPYGDAAFDVVTNAVSVDYLTRPREIFAETARVLRPGGLAIMSFSNRCFATKAISLWTSTGDLEHCYIVATYFRFTPGFEASAAHEITKKPGLLQARGDPMYVVVARKAAA
jgi:hypothetical protein